jgi:NitT/TauT family transport system ATP-binding protein
MDDAGNFRGGQPLKSGTDGSETDLLATKPAPAMQAMCIEDRANAKDTAQASQPMVELLDVSLRYGEMLALANATLSIDPGGFIAVVGPSGCGKSTLMKLVTGLLPPTSGEVRLDGKRVEGPVRGAGMAFQNATLLPWRSTLDNVMLPLEIVEPFKRMMRHDRKGLEARAQKLLASVGLGEFGASLPWQLSGGMQQRANLCRSIVHDPKLLMLDEPFAALDAFTKEDLWQVLQELWLRQHFTAILVTHDLREAAFLADTVYVMSQRPGRIVRRYPIDIPRPRTLATTFDPAYTDIVNELRARIAEVRSQ